VIPRGFPRGSSLGFILTIIWWYVNRRQLIVIGQIAREAEAIEPIYKKIRENRSRTIISSTWLLAHFVPMVVGISWLAILLFGQQWL
jgi:Na+/H+ antiporter NhaC